MSDKLSKKYLTKREMMPYLLEVFEYFKPKGKEVLINKVAGRYLLEQDLLLKHCGEKGKVLDVGGGVSIALLCLAKINKELGLYLIDNFNEYNEKHSVTTKEHLLSVLKGAGIQVAEHDFFERKILPYDNEYFDVVTAFDVIEHFPEPPFKLLGEIRRVLKKDGTLIVSVPNLLSTARRGRMLLGKHPYIYFEEWIQEKYFGHYRECTRKEWQIIIKMAGFSNIKSFMANEPTRTKAINSYHNKKYSKYSLPALGLWLLYFLDLMIPSLRTEIYYIAHPDQKEGK